QPRGVAVGRRRLQRGGRQGLPRGGDGDEKPEAPYRGPRQYEAKAAPHVRKSVWTPRRPQASRGPLSGAIRPFGEDPVEPAADSRQDRLEQSAAHFFAWRRISCTTA